MKTELAVLFVTSLIGSWHCAAMCGPFAIMASDRATGEKSTPYKTSGLYHLGKLLSYFLIVSLVYALARPWMEIQKAFHLEKFGYFIAALLLLTWFYLLFFQPLRLRAPQFLTYLLKKSVAMSSSLRATSMGFITGFIPCIWLYGFIGLASTRPTYASAFTTIFVFWLGTLPSLIAVQVLGLRIRNHMNGTLRKAAVLLMIISTGVSVAWRSQSLSQHSNTVIQPGESCHKH